MHRNESEIRNGQKQNNRKSFIILLSTFSFINYAAQMDARLPDFAEMLLLLCCSLI